MPPHTVCHFPQNIISSFYQSLSDRDVICLVAWYGLGRTKAVENVLPLMPMVLTVSAHLRKQT